MPAFTDQQTRALIDGYLCSSGFSGPLPPRLGSCNMSDFEPLVAAPPAAAREALLEFLPIVERAERQLKEIVATVAQHPSGTEEYWLAAHCSMHLRFAIQATFQKKTLPLTDQDLSRLVDFLAGSSGIDALSDRRFVHSFPYSLVIAAVERFAKKQELSPKLQDRLLALIPALSDAAPQREATQLRGRVEKLVQIEPVIELEPGEPWSDAALRFLDSQPPEARRFWVRLLAHCQQVASGAPKEKWLAKALALLEPIGKAAFAAVALEWISLVEMPRPSSPDFVREDQRWWISDAHQQILKGLIQSLTLCDGAPIGKPLTAAALSTYMKVPASGPRAIRVGNACVWTLANIGAGELSALALLRVRVKARAGQKAIDTALSEISERTGVPREELDELGVPAYGLTEVGARHEVFGAFEAELVLPARGKAVITFSSQGKTYKSTPASVKQNHKQDLSELQEVAEDAEAMLSAQRQRLDGLFTAQRVWPFETWRERYLDHPLLGVLSRRLIWSFRRESELTPAIWLDGALVDVLGRSFTPSPETEVLLWHPYEASVEGVQAWRAFLEAHQLKQPFKQAFRELYLLTDAERASSVYSNRFAAHVVNQAQFNALCRERGWNTTARLDVDADLAPPTRDLPAWDLRAEFWVTSVAGETNPVGSYLYLSTDQLRFYPRSAARNETQARGGGYASRGADEAANRPLPLESIPPLVLSEVMRDVDLFVGVSSVGNDPIWTQGGQHVERRDYWESYGFGELSELAKTRRTVLERLLPRLKIREQCQLTDRFLVVKGKRASYEIHLSSSNVRILPSGHYLCIVSAPFDAKADPVFLPFDDDARLTAILSKAMLLARDDRITDPSIARQIESGLAR